MTVDLHHVYFTFSNNTANAQREEWPNSANTFLHAPLPSTQASRMPHSPIPPLHPKLLLPSLHRWFLLISPLNVDKPNLALDLFSTNIHSLGDLIPPHGFKYSWPSSNTGLNCTGPLNAQMFFSSKYYSTTWFVIGWIHRCRTLRYGGITYFEGQLQFIHEFSTARRVSTPKPLCCLRVSYTVFPSLCVCTYVCWYICSLPCKQRVIMIL